MMYVSLSQPLLPSHLVHCRLNFWKRNFVLNSVGYLEDLKILFWCNSSITQGQFLIAGKKFSRDKVANFVQRKMSWSTITLLFNQNKRPKHSKSSIYFQFQLLFNVFIFSFMYSFKSMKIFQRSLFSSLVWVSSSEVCIRFSVSLLNRHSMC